MSPVSSFVFVDQIGYAPIPLDFQSSASTKLASRPIVPNTLFYNYPRESSNLLYCERGVALVLGAAVL